MSGVQSRKPILMVALVCLISAVASAQSLPGFQLNGENWTYAVSGQATISGILVKPAGDGPFPAVIISHGKGGTAQGFALPKAREMASWGMVCIGPNYTHGEQGSDPTKDGARPENMRRARACVDILDSLAYVNRDRIYAYGNSMGAFVTAQLAADLPERITAAAITAGGIVESGDWPAPNVTEAESIRSPFCILHGTADTTVSHVRSELLKQVLDGNSVPNERRLYEGIGHDLHNVLASEVYTRIHDWFDLYGTPSPPAPAHVDRPRGVFVLDSQAGTPYSGQTLRDANIRSYDFVTGYALRVWWDFVETSQGVYDFTIIDNIFSKLPATQKLSLLLGPMEPAYIAQTQGVTTWQDVDRYGNPITRAVPWDPFLRERRRAFLEALASHPVGGIPLRDHPRLVAIDPYLPGRHTGIRDPNSRKLRDLPGYTRSGFLAAVQDELRTLTTSFPDKFVQIGFWKFTDYEGGTEAWEQVRQAILAEFNGVTRPEVGFFMENLAASRPAPGVDPVTCYPVTDFGAPLFLSKDQTWTAFQALTSWKAPFTGADKVANGTPADGMKYAYDTYGTTYFELYVNDIDNSPWHTSFRAWHDTLHNAQSVGSAKKLADSAYVTCADAIVTAVFGDVFYIERADRSAGIRARKPGHGLGIGYRVKVSGVMVTELGERFIDATNGTVSGAQDAPLGPLSMPNRALGGSEWLSLAGVGQPGVSDGRGLNNIGLLVTVWGQASSITGGSFLITDGSRTDPIVVQLGAIAVPTGLREGSTVVVTGICSCRQHDTGSLSPIVLPRTTSDIAVMD